MSEAVMIEGVTVAALAAFSFALGWWASGRRRRRSRS